MNKFKYISLYTILSLIIVLLLIFFVFYYYPLPLIKATGASKLILITSIAILLLGPFLSLIIHNKNKKSLFLDTIYLVSLQLLALGFGVYTLYEGRPIWIVYNVDRFDLVRFNEIDTRRISQANIEYQNTNITGVKYVAIVIPEDNIEKRNEILFDEVSFGIAPSQKPELYQPINTVKKHIIDKGKNLSDLNIINGNDKAKLILERYHDVKAYLPLKANTVDMTVLINSEGNIIDIVDLKPWL